MGWQKREYASAPGLLCQSGRRRPENVSVPKLQDDSARQLIVVISNMHDNPCYYISFDSKVLKEA